MKKLKKFWGVIKPLVPQILMIFTLVLGFYTYTTAMVNIAKIEADRRAAKIQEEMKVQQAEMKKTLDAAAKDIKHHTDVRFKQIDAIRTEVFNTIVQEAAKDPRFTDEEKGASQEMIDAMNRARAETRK